MVPSEGDTIMLGAVEGDTIMLGAVGNVGLTNFRWIVLIIHYTKSKLQLKLRFHNTSYCLIEVVTDAGLTNLIEVVTDAGLTVT